MFNLFKKDEQENQKTVFVDTKQKTELELIQEIHNSVDSAQDLLLKEALEVLAAHKLPEQEVKNAERLRRLGFHSTQEVEKLNTHDQKVSLSKALSENIVHYKNRYPFLKFLTMGELDKICNKYGLVYARVSQYIGSVPEKNITEIENAQSLDPADYEHKGTRAPFKNKKTGQTKGFHYLWEIYGEAPVIIPEQSEDPNDWEFIENHSWGYQPAREPVLEIAAPKAMFRMDVRTVQVGNELVQKDPIVFRRVRGGIQVLTKWGLEANDSALINPINN